MKPDIQSVYAIEIHTECGKIYGYNFKLGKFEAWHTNDADIVRHRTLVDSSLDDAVILFERSKRLFNSMQIEGLKAYSIVLIMMKATHDAIGNIEYLHDDESTLIAEYIRWAVWNNGKWIQ